MSKTDPNPFPYRISAVAELSGLPSSTIRTWERRYAAVEPQRTPGGARRYCEIDVERLTLIRLLAEDGMAVSDLAAMPMKQLRKLRVKTIEAAPRGPVRVALLEPSLRARWEKATSARTIGISALDQFHTLEDVLNSKETLDFLVVHLDALGAKPGQTLRSVRATVDVRGVVVAYSYANATTLAQLASHGAWLFRLPATTDELAHLLRLAQPVAAASKVDAPIFDDAALGRLMELQPDIACECPRHLATLVSSLLAFERYSSQCEDQSPEDAALHARLARGTAQARQTMEQLLVNLCETEGIDTDPIK